MNFKLTIKYCMLAVIPFFVYCCKNYNRKDLDIKYSFFVAGHTYGKPGDTTGGLYKPFMDKTNLIKDNDNIKFGVFTGDIVVKANEKYWDLVDRDLKSLGKPVYFAPGNHDMGNRKLFIERYGPSYYSYIYENDIFIILDPNIDRWNITGPQLYFLDSTLENINDSVNHVFVFLHQLLWCDSENIFRNIRLNSKSGRADSINFWPEIIPLFQKVPKDIVFFAGDLGASRNNDDYMYYKQKNITFIASGMGEGKGDNFIIVDVLEDNTINYRLVSLNTSDINAMGSLTDYTLP